MKTIFKEIVALIKLLFISNPNDCKDVELYGMNYFPFKNYKYMMWCGKMIYRLDSPIDFNNGDNFEKNKNHERIHLYEAKKLGSWLKFYSIYMIEWVKGNPFCKPFISAYYTIPFEMEAYANEDDYNYCDNYDGKYLKSYNIKNRKETFKKFKSISKWKEYIKNINKIK